MGLSVIGAGYGRTGTLSLKSALEQLGYNKCHHMIEVIHKQGEAERWMAAIDNPSVPWDDMLTGYQATVDWPACHFYKELAEYYPAAKVLLSVRDPKDWFDSMAATTLRVIGKRLADSPNSKNLGSELVVKAALEGITDNAEHAIAMFNKHIDEVKSTIKPERLLVFDVREGWEPLCAFLDKPVPEVPFPRTNSRDEFEEIFFGSGGPG